MKAELLRVLREADGYISGQQLCERFGVSRTAVWKVIHQLQDEGYEIEGVKNKGYRLWEESKGLSAAAVLSRLHTEWMGQNCLYLETVDSTNHYVKRIAEEGAVDGTLVMAEEQTQGRGRKGRSWYSPCGEQIAMSLLLRPSIRPEHASRLTLLMAMAVAVAIRRVTGLEAGIKWPNDVVVHGKKICGILTEMSAEVDYINYVVIGTGINVNQTSFPEELSQIAGSLAQELGHKVSRGELVAACINELEGLYRTFQETEDLSKFKDDYNALCVNCGRQIRVLEPGNEYVGSTQGINERGELMVLREGGTLTSVYAGEVSVRGLYGYT